MQRKYLGQSFAKAGGGGSYNSSNNDAFRNNHHHSVVTTPMAGNTNNNNNNNNQSIDLDISIDSISASLKKPRMGMRIAFEMFFRNVHFGNIPFRYVVFVMSAFEMSH